MYGGGEVVFDSEECGGGGGVGGGGELSEAGSAVVSDGELDGGRGRIVEDVPAFKGEGVGTLVEFAKGVVYLAVAAVLDVGLKVVV